MTDGDEVVAAIIHDPEDKRVVCRECAFDLTTRGAVDDADLERIPAENVGAVLYCRDCERDIAASLTNDT